MQIITETGSHRLEEVQFMSPFKFLTRWPRQHVGITVLRHVSHAFESQQLTNSCRNQKHQYKTLQGQFVVRSTLTRIEGQHRHSTDEG